MAEREVRIKFTGDTGVLKGQAGELRTLFANLVNDTDDVRDAGAKWADAYSQQSRRIQQEMDDISTSAEVLADSMGPEMVRALEQSGRSVEEQVQELIKLGLTHDDIRVSSDELAQAIRERDDVLRQGAGEMGDGMRKVADETARAKDINASFIGNAVTELPGIGDAFGPANEAISQFVENMLTGEVGLKSLASGGALIGGVALAMSMVTSAQAEWEKRQAELRKQNDEFADSLKSTGDAVDGMIAKWREAGKIEIWTNAVDGMEDMLPLLDKFGLSITDFEKFIREEPDDRGIRQMFNTWVLEMEKAGVTSEELTPLIEGVASAHDSAAQAAQGAALVNKVFTMSQEDATAAVDNFLRNKDPISEFPDEFERMARAMSEGTAPAAADLEKVTEELGLTTDQALQIASDYADELRTGVTEAHQRAAAAADEARLAERQLLDARRSAIDSAYAVTAAQDAYTEAVERAKSATDDKKTSVDEYRQAQDDAAQSALSLADAVAEDARAKAEANGQTLSDIELDQIRIEQLYAMALALDADSPLRAALIDHIHTLQGVPSSIITEVSVDGVEDAVNRIGFVRQQAAGEIPATVSVNVAGTDDAVGRIGFVRQQAEDDMGSATDATNDLGAAIDELPDKVEVTFDLVGYDVFMSKLRSARDLLHEVQRAADDAERAVSRVAD